MAKKKGKNVQTQAYQEEDSDYGERFVSPPGQVGFCAIEKPYEGQYIAQLRYEAGDAADAATEFFEEILGRDDRKGKTASPVRAELDDDGNPTGAVTVRFKQNAGGKKKDGGTWEHRLTIGKPKGSADEQVGAGSTLIVQFTVRQTTYQGDNFLQLVPRKIKVTDLVPFVPDGDDFFDDDMDVATASAKKSQVSTGRDDADDGDDDDDDDVDW